ncbi:hypothetical protein LQ757_10565 [Agromyces sp. SYSU K20354]|uniref:hypothetical protein n=1 Tax=Agromyces cavernae TaxID=2898659 RepID=UPI001E636CBA|nr:hypothetical protein [Agromyces cavernae]MCD2442715.1 hypothetical protein [Agromyces cavernae]
MNDHGELDLTSERAGGHRRWRLIAAVAASIAIVGAAGYGLGTSTGGATSLADGAAPPISLQPGGPESSTMQGGPVIAPGIATDQETMSSSFAADDFAYPNGYGRDQFSASGLATDDGTAGTYAFDARAASNIETASLLAAALGVEGTPELKDDSWTVGQQGGTDPHVSIGPDGASHFFYTNPPIDPYYCLDDAGVTVPCEATGDIPTEEAAIEALRSLIMSVGHDPNAFEFESVTSDGDQAMARSAQAWLVVDGQRFGMAWSLELTNDGVLGARGALAPIVPLGDYPVVSEQEGFERLSDPRFNPQLGFTPFDGPALVVSEGGMLVTPTKPPATPTEGTSLSWPVNEVEIVSARLGLASQWQPDGSVLVIPAYEFTDAEGGTWSVIAVADSMLDFVSD